MKRQQLRTYKPRKYYKSNNTNKTYSTTNRSIIYKQVPNIANTVYPFTRMTKTNFSLNESQGLGGSGTFDFQIAYSLRYTYLYYGGVLLANVLNNGYDEFTSLFQRWRIKKIEIMMTFSANSNTVTAAYTLPIIWMANDYTDASSTNVNQIQQYNNAKVVQLGNGATKFEDTKYGCYPKLSAGAFQQGSAGVPAYYAPQNGAWVDTDYPATTYYGTKFAYDFDGSASTSNIGQLGLFFKYYLEFKTTK